MRKIIAALSASQAGRALLEGIVFAGLAALFLAPRLPALGQFVTADEGTWGKRAASFYYALGDGDYAKTYQTGHPGVTTMWAGAAAYAWKFPEFQRVGQVDLGDTRLLDLFERRGPNPMELLKAARIFVALACAAAVLAAYGFARALFGLPLSAAMFVLLAFDPFHVAHSRYLHTNGLLASFMFLSILSLIYYVERRRWPALIVSGAAGGLAIISITPGLLVIPAAGVVALLGLRDPQSGAWDLRPARWLRRWALPLVLWAGAAWITIFLVWPAMWARPVGTLADIVRYGLSAAGGEIGTAQFVEAYGSDYDPSAKYVYFYPLSYLWRATPVALGGLLLAVGFVFAGRRSLRTLLNPEQRRAAAALLVFVLAYLILMSLGSKKFDRYFLPAYPPLDLLAVLGWFAAAQWLADKLPRYSRRAVLAAGLLLVLVVQAAGTLRTFPYYNTYYNPLLGGLRRAPEVMAVGWGEGLHLAAQYLKEQPDIQKKKIISWYTLSFNWYAASLGFQAQPVDVSTQIPLQQYLENDYIVVYINQAQRKYPPALMDYLAGVEPVHVVTIDGVEFAWVYHLPQASP